MLTTIRLVAVILIFLLSISSITYAGEVTDEFKATSINLTVTGIEQSKGSIRIAVYRYPDSIRWTDNPFRTLTIDSPLSDTEQFTIQNVPPGQYAIRMFQDLNENQQLNRSTKGFPTEPFGFSMIERLSRRPPTIKSSSFTVEQHAPTTQAITIKLLTLKSQAKRYTK